MKKIQRQRDMHPQDILAALRKRGHTATGLSTANNLDRTAVSKAARRPWPKVEKIIADALEVKPSEIWPTRYAQGAQK